MTTFVVKDFSMLFLTNLQSRCRAAELWCCGEVSSSARGDDDRHTRHEEQRASGLAKVVKSNLGKPGLSKHRVIHLTDEIALAEIGSGVGTEYPFQPEEPSRPPLRLPSCYALMENALIPPWKPDSFRLADDTLTNLRKNHLRNRDRGGSSNGYNCTPTCLWHLENDSVLMTSCLLWARAGWAKCTVLGIRVWTV